MLSVTFMRAVSVECIFLWPLWYVDSLSRVVKNSTNCLCASLSLTFERMGNYEIGLLLAGSSEFPSLGTGVTSAIFHALGKAAILNKLFTNLEITGAMLSQLSFRTRAEILSYSWCFVGS